jgi:hypothetical protein
MFKFALIDKMCHTFQAYPKDEDLAQAPEPGVFLCNKKEDIAHLIFCIVFECKISQKSILQSVKLENVVEMLEVGCQEDYPTPVQNLIRAADRAIHMFTSNPTHAAAEWMAAFPHCTRELVHWVPAMAQDRTLLPQTYNLAMKEGEPATIPRTSTSEVPLFVTNRGKAHKNFQVMINTKGG